MGLIDHAIRELEFLNNGDEMNAMMRADILEMVETFANQGHSGFSAPYAIAHLIPLLKQKPVGPLTGADDEWGEPFDDKGTRQNKRCGSVFKNADGSAYDIDQVVFIDRRNGCTYTCRDSHNMSVVKFPYTPFRREIKEPLTRYWRQRLVDALGSIESVLVKEKRPQFAAVEVATNVEGECCGSEGCCDGADTPATIKVGDTVRLLKPIENLDMSATYRVVATGVWSGADYVQLEGYPDQGVKCSVLEVVGGDDCKGCCK